MLFLTFFLMLILIGLATGVAVFSMNSIVSGRSQLQDRQAYYIAEAGWQHARRQLVTGGQACGWSASDQSFGAGAYTVTTTDNGDNTCTIASSGYVPNATTYAARRQVTERSVPVTTSSGTNLSLAAIAAASSSNGSNTPSKANDNNTGTKWESGTNGSGSWLSMDYGSAKTLDKIVVQENNFIDNLTIEWSDDNSSWSAPSGLSVSSQGKTWTCTFTAASHRYFRARFTDVPSSKKASVDEMESYRTSSSLGTGTMATQW